MSLEVWDDEGNIGACENCGLEPIGCKCAPGLREALTEALDTWELYPLPLKKKVEILLDLFAATQEE